MRLSNYTLGVIGGGQLGRMLCMVARRMNIKTVVWTGGLEAPAAEIADEVIEATFDSESAIQTFAAKATHATVEFENIPLTTLEKIDKLIPLKPSPQAIAICQHREREKNFLREHNIPCAPFELITNAQELKKAVDKIGPNCILKTAAFGYDGKGQIRLYGNEDFSSIWDNFECDRAILEGFIPFSKELSVMVSRNQDGKYEVYDPAENEHRHHILDVSIVPARIDETSLEAAKKLAVKIAETMNYVGIMGVEFFLLENGSLIVNEMAPRPHNSGHHTIDACATSQFEQQLRAVLDLPLGSSRLHSPVVMLNLLGDMWLTENQEPDWSPLLLDGETSLHLYGKSSAKGRRKMGHANIIGKDIDHALTHANNIKTALIKAANRN